MALAYVFVPLDFKPRFARQYAMRKPTVEVGFLINQKLGPILAT
jgi:hypothetical protein